MYKIDKNVPIPQLNNNRIKYPWSELKIGDSFTMNGSGHSLVKYRNERYSDKQFVARKEDDHYRIWRIK